ncbi:MAG: hypothetical protein GDA56_15630 [Hormoscilla sp. GM7CHS1pb]|nr:hypothetical protein [Hormoscilla sp. GM7CHS1pb]
MTCNDGWLLDVSRVFAVRPGDIERGISLSGAVRSRGLWANGQINQWNWIALRK